MYLTFYFLVLGNIETSVKKNLPDLLNDTLEDHQDKDNNILRLIFWVNLFFLLSIVVGLYINAWFFVEPISGEVFVAELDDFLKTINPEGCIGRVEFLEDGSMRIVLIERTLQEKRFDIWTLIESHGGP
jgi:hypothetical protein